MNRLRPAWPTAKLADLCQAINGRAFKPTEWRRSGLPIIRIQNLKDPCAELNYFDGPVDPKHEVSEGDLLFAWSGTPGTSFGAHIWRGGRAVLNQHIFNLKFDRERVDGRFFMYALNQNVNQYVSQAHGGVGLGHITKGKFMASEVPLPPIAEQLRIVEEIEKQLTRLEATIASLNRVKANLRRYRAGVVNAAVTGRLVHPEAELADSGGRPRDSASALLTCLSTRAQPSLEDLPSGWCWARLDEVTSELISGTPVAATDTPTSRPVLRSSAVRPGQLDLQDHRYLPENAKRASDPYIREGDLLFTRLSGSLEYVANCAVVQNVADLRMEFPDRLFRGRCLPGILGQYVQLCLRDASLRAPLEQRARSTAGHQRISLSDLRAFVLPLPPTQEQVRIVGAAQRLLSLADSVESVVLGSQQRIGGLRQTILRAAFQGALLPLDG